MTTKHGMQSTAISSAFPNQFERSKTKTPSFPLEVKYKKLPDFNKTTISIATSPRRQHSHMRGTMQNAPKQAFP
jgi:hypothetical protein